MSTPVYVNGVALGVSRKLGSSLIIGGVSGFGLRILQSAHFFKIVFVTFLMPCGM